MHRQKLCMLAAPPLHTLSRNSKLLVQHCLWFSPTEVTVYC